MSFLKCQNRYSGARKRKWSALLMCNFLCLLDFREVIIDTWGRPFALRFPPKSGNSIDFDATFWLLQKLQLKKIVKTTSNMV